MRYGREVNHKFVKKKKKGCTPVIWLLVTAEAIETGAGVLQLDDDICCVLSCRRPSAVLSVVQQWLKPGDEFVGKKNKTAFTECPTLLLRAGMEAELVPLQAWCCGMALLCPWKGRETAEAAQWPRADEYEADRESSLTLRQDL